MVWVGCLEFGLGVTFYGVVLIRFGWRVWWA